MLKSLILQGVGPAERTEIEPGSRLNLFTGDNGLGKSFLLDVAWWVLTRTWAGLPALGRRNGRNGARIEWTLKGKIRRLLHDESHIQSGQPPDFWPRKPGRPPMVGLTLYARVDGGFSVWDPARNYWRKSLTKGVDAPERPEAYHFTNEEVWSGLPLRAPEKLCLGLLQDWILWQSHPREGSFRVLERVLHVLSPDPRERMVPGENPVKLSVADVRPVPTLELPYGTIPIVHASAGMKRILALAYLLVWAWKEHREASAALGQKPDRRLILLLDEVEAHLHPRWQRLILPAILAAVKELNPQVSIQILATTHSPMVLASVEPIFDEEQDRLYVFDLANKRVELREQRWAKQGDATNWLVSEVFGLQQARSPEAERAIEAAEAFMRGDPTPPGLRTRQQIHAELRRVLPDHDDFWPRWIVAGQRRAQ
jgi:hypothetical protein